MDVATKNRIMAQEPSSTVTQTMAKLFNHVVSQTVVQKIGCTLTISLIIGKNQRNS